MLDQVLEIKRKYNSENLCVGNASAVKKLADVIFSLKYEEEPDYEFLHQILELSILESSLEEEDNEEQAEDNHSVIQEQRIIKSNKLSLSRT